MTAKTTPTERAEKAAARAKLLADHQQLGEQLPDTMKEAQEAIRDDNEPITDQQIEDIITLIACGHTLTKILKMRGAPSRYKFMSAVTASSDYMAALSHAREAGAVIQTDQTIDIADEIALDSTAVQRNKLRIDARMRLAGAYNQRFSPQMSAESVGNVIASVIEAARSRHKAINNDKQSPK